jgi:hypothetical protein
MHEQLGEPMMPMNLSNRQRKAPFIFGQFYQRLADGISIDPGPELPRVRDRLRRNDPLPSPAAPPVATRLGVAAGETTASCQLPGDCPVVGGYR